MWIGYLVVNIGEISAMRTLVVTLVVLVVAVMRSSHLNGVGVIGSILLRDLLRVVNMIGVMAVVEKGMKLDFVLM